MPYLKSAGRLFASSISAAALLCVVTLMGALQFNAHAQNRLLKDTIYYLADTARIPKQDRMLNIYPEAGLICFEINCPCLGDNQYPVLRYNKKDRVKHLSQNDLNQLKLTSLPVLVKYIKEMVDDDYKERYVINIIEPDENDFKMHVAAIQPLRVRKPTDGR